MSDREPLLADNGEEIKHMDDSYFTFLNRSIFIYGPSKTGKTVTVKHILNRLRPYIPIVLLVCPSEPSNNSYQGIVPRAAIHTSITKDFLESTWNRQEASAQIFASANKLEVLQKLYMRVPHSRTDKLITHLDDIYIKSKHKTNKISNEGQKEAELIILKEKFEDVLKGIYKKHISENADILADFKNLSTEEQLTLKYINFCPRLLLIFDDAAAILKKFRNLPVMEDMLYRGRHAQITLMVVNHSDKTLPKELRTNAFVSIYGSSEVAMQFFNNGSGGNGFTLEQFKYVKGLVKKVFEEKERSPEKYRKFVWLRDMPEPYAYFLADIVRTFMFGSEAFIELCTKIEKDNTSLDTNNPFYHSFVS